MSEKEKTTKINLHAFYLMVHFSTKKDTDFSESKDSGQDRTDKIDTNILESTFT